MIKNENRKFIACLLTFVMVVISFAVMPMSVMAENTAYENINIQDDREALEYSILTSTLNGAVGMQGFYDDYAITDPDEIVEIIVQFRTPSAVALRLMEERGIYSYDLGRAQIFDCFYAQALTAHAAFQQQLEGLPIPLSANGGIEIFCETHQLFNGVHMRVPGGMVSQISQLPEVFLVEPHIIPVLPEPAVIDEPLALATTDASQSPFFINPNLMRTARDMFEIDYIHNELGITGRGVRVAMLDSGIDHTHPEFERFRDPYDFNYYRHYNYPRIRGWNSHRNNFYLESDPRGHGTMTAGSIIAMAPEIELWSFNRVGFGTFTGIGALEAARNIEGGVDIIYTWVFAHWGVREEHPFDLHTAAVTMAVLDGIIVVAAAHNFGPNLFTIQNPGNSPLAITVGAGTAGCDNHIWRYERYGIIRPRNEHDAIPSYSGRGPAERTYHIKPDIIAPGVNGISTVPGGYGLFNGTSMAGPVMTGIAALLVQQFPYAPPYEIKARIMNTARSLADYPNPSVFSTGAGFVRPLEALRADTIVTTRHYVPVRSNWSSPFELHTMVSLSFGRINLYDENQNNMIPVQITNRSDTYRTYTVSYYFTRNAGNAASLEFKINGLDFDIKNENISVSANSMFEFETIINFDDNASTGFYEGFVYIWDEYKYYEPIARLPFAARTVESYIHFVSNEEELRDALRIAGREPAIIYFTENIYIDTMLSIPYAQITLRSYGAETYALILTTIPITFTGDNNSVIQVPGPARLTLDGIKVTRASGTRGSGIRNSGRLVMLDGSVISGNNSNTSGGGVSNGGTFIMHGGVISNNSAPRRMSGGGVNNWGTFVMYGGKIFSNSAEAEGGGVNNNGTFIIHGGEIFNNTATRGGGIFINGEFHCGDTVGEPYYHVQVVGNFIMHSGAIFDNTANRGAGIYANGNIVFSEKAALGMLYNWKFFNIYNGEISGNISNEGGGIFVEINIYYVSDVELWEIIPLDLTILSGYNWKALAIHGGSIHNNTAQLNGGGIGVSADNLRNGRVFIGENAVFHSNTAMNGGRNRTTASNDIYAANIHGTRWTFPHRQGFNNHDIQYDVNPNIVDYDPEPLVPTTWNDSVYRGGNIFIFGGEGADGQPSNLVQIMCVRTLDIQNPQVVMLSTLNFDPRYGHTATLVGNEVWIVGGRTIGGVIATHIDIFDVEMGEWNYISLPNNFVPSAYHTTVYYDGSLFVMGGWTNGGTLNSTIEINTNDRTVRILPPMLIPRHQHTATIWNNQIWTIGGRNNQNIVGNINIFDIAP